jgi:hypothetical protein
VSISFTDTEAIVLRQSNCEKRCAAWTNQNPEVITTLLKTGADVNARYNNGGTGFMWAASENPNTQAITTLLKAGADIKPEDDTCKANNSLPPRRCPDRFQGPLGAFGGNSP